MQEEQKTRMGGLDGMEGENEIGELLCFLGSGARCLWGHYWMGVRPGVIEQRESPAALLLSFGRPKTL